MSGEAIVAWFASVLPFVGHGVMIAGVVCAFAAGVFQMRATRAGAPMSNMKLWNPDPLRPWPPDARRHLEAASIWWGRAIGLIALGGSLRILAEVPTWIAGR
ncbi:hypothetical protein [Neoroseomonas rubea]|uniref:hypothetical protein n=1 Tax=Neoroseomonas rubea TaxID=2748666 RepID=UPI0018DFFE34|nr:hypothetical protein [Roseomonas rubea]